MAITIKGIRLESLDLKLNHEAGTYEVSAGKYSLVSSVEKVIATQDINGYGVLKIQMSPQTWQDLHAFIQSFKADVQAVLGLDLE